MTQSERLKKIGFGEPEDLMKIAGVKRTLARGVLSGRIPISKKMALAIKRAKGTSLDFILGE